MSAQSRFTPYISSVAVIPEFTLRAVLLGTILGIIFGASSLYLVLKVGLTVSASIPVAVISLTIFKLLSKATGVRDATILENNIAQTAGSAGESIAFGVGVTMPAIMILGFDLELTRVMLVAILGALLGILMMIPLRRALIVYHHDTLKYPEGTACAQVLKAGASAESRAAASDEAKAEEARGLGVGISAHTIFLGFGIGLAYKAGMAAFKGWKDVPEKVFGGTFKAGSLSCEISPELLGVGYIIGPVIGSVMCAGGVLAYLVLIPMIKFFGSAITGPLPPGTIPIADMDISQIRSAYVLYIGAGAVAAGGIISLIRSLPTIGHSLKEALKDVGATRGVVADPHRTDRDMPGRFVFAGIAVLVIMILFSKSLHMNLLGAVLLVVFGFLFVTVSSRLTGEIGSSSNPISGMTIATLLLTCLVFLMLGWTTSNYYVTALSVAGIVCVAASNGGTTSQDLKSGYLIGATPKLQQWAIIIGSLASAVALGPVLLALNETSTVYVPVAQLAPAGLQADVTSMSHATTTLTGPQARSDSGRYHIWHKPTDDGAPSGKYLVDDGGRAVWFVDPGINGRFNKRPDGSEVRKFDAPKATLMSYIIRGVLDRQLPWGLVLFGVMIAVVLEMSGVGSLAFAVGVYLPLSTSVPLFIGGMVRWLVDLSRNRELLARGIAQEHLAAESDKSAGVLMASGYIAGGAIAGIIIAFMAGVFDQVDAALTNWANEHNPFYAGPNADVLALVPFAAITLLLYLVGREKVFAPKTRPAKVSSVAADL